MTNWAPRSVMTSLGVQLQSQSRDDLEDSVEARTALAGKRFVKAFSRDNPASRATCDMPLARAMSPSALAWHKCSIAASLFEAGFTIGGHFLCVLRVFSNVVASGNRRERSRVSREPGQRAERTPRVGHRQEHAQQEAFDEGLRRQSDFVIARETLCWLPNRAANIYRLAFCPDWVLFPPRVSYAAQLPARVSFPPSGVSPWGTHYPIRPIRRPHSG